jgi:hypothetical protein
VSELLKLAALCEKAEGPDRELDADVFKALGAPVPFQFMNKLIALEFNDVEQAYFARVSDDMQVRYSPPAYTASLDAALTLVPEGLEWELLALDAARDPRFGRFQARIMLLTYAEDPEELGPQAIANAATPALALCAASLRARDAAERDRRAS